MDGDPNNFQECFDSGFWNHLNKNTDLFDVPKAGAAREKFIADLFWEISEKKYYPSTPKLYQYQEKENGVVRVIPVFSVKDYCVFYFCIRSIEEKIAVDRVENTFGGWTMGGMMRRSENDEMKNRAARYNTALDLFGVSASDYSFNPSAWAKAYGELNSRLYATAREGDYERIVELDIANFYDSVRLDILETRVREKFDNNSADVISLLFHFLNYWNRRDNLYNKQTVGLPQDKIGDCSRILANFYLQPYDRYISEFCNNHKCKYLRFADDQFIFVKKGSQIPSLMFSATKELNSIGLSINQKKVRNMTMDEMIEHRSFEIFDVLSKEESGKDADCVEEFAIKVLGILDQADKSKLRQRGLSLLKRCLSCEALSEINRQVRNRILEYCLFEKNLKCFEVRHFSAIYCLLSGYRRKDFENRIRDMAAEHIDNAFHYNVLSFFRKNEIDTSLIEDRIVELEKID